MVAQIIKETSYGREDGDINVAKFIKENITPYYGDDSFLCGPTARTLRIWSKVSELMKEERKKGVLEYKELLNKYAELAKKVVKPEDNGNYPNSIKNSSALRALYDNFGENESLALQIHQAVLSSKLDGFRDNPVKEKQIKRELLKVLGTKEKTEKVFKLIYLQEEY